MSEKLYPVPAEWKQRAFIDARNIRTCTRARSRIPTASGASRPSASTGSSPTPRSRTPRSTCTDVSIKWFEDGVTQRRATTASTGISPSAATRSRSSGRATIRTKTGRSPTASCTTQVCRFANVLKAQGVKKGDRVTIYMPMIPEAAYAMLACARIGAVHSVVFGGFSPDSLAGRIEDCQIDRRHHRRRGPARRAQGPAQGQRRRGRRRRPAASSTCSSCERTGGAVDMEPGRDV